MKGLHLFTRTALVALFATALVASAFAASPATVKLTVTPDPAPGAAVTVKAAVTMSDGSAVQSVSWKQTSGITLTVSGATTDTITTTLPGRKALRDHLIETLEEPGVADSALPSWVPTRAANFYGGLQERFQVVGVSNHALSDAATFGFDVTVVTSTGTYKVPATFAATTPWTTATGQRNVAINVPVVLHAPAPSDPKVPAVYNWTLTVPTNSKAALVDANAQNPEFTPDVAGAYKLTATNAAGATPASFTVYAGTWKGIVVGQDAKGRPMTDPNCKSCHVGQTEVFTPWAQSGHAEILTQNLNTPGASHYGESCWECHAVGYTGTALKNNGLADQPDFAGMEKDFGHMTQGDPLNWTKLLTSYPAAARMTNIQCENCHGPQNSDAHGQTASRVSLSSDVCAVCHGEPARHGRFQQWQLSGHANFETAISEGTNASCAKCHSAQGYMQWEAQNYASNATIKVTWTADEVQPQTCVVCHDPHAEGTTSGDANTNATMRIMDKTPMLDAGFQATGVGKAAECIACHNSRRGLKDDQHFTVADAARAPHEGPQADIVLGQNLYFAKVGTKGYHGMLADSCVTCHMNKTAAPAVGLISMAGQTNHTFYADPGICSSCHSEITAAQIQGDVQNKLATLKTNIEAAIKASMQAQIRAGNTIDFGSGIVAKNAADIGALSFVSSHGSQGINATIAGKNTGDLALTGINVVRPGGSKAAIATVYDPAIAKAGWNYFMVEADKSEGVHNPVFVKSALDVAAFATANVVTQLNTTTTSAPGGVSPAAIGGGLGNGAGAVSCNTAYVYWTEIASHAPGANGSQWRTDLVTRNLGTANANVKFYLHQADGTTLNGTGAVNGGAQKAFEDVVATLGGGNNMGSLEVCSDQPLLVNARVYNAATSGTFGQNLDGAVADVGYAAGQTVNLIGLRQKSGKFRTNLSVTNGGTTAAQVSISLFDATGTSIKTYTLSVPAGQVVQDNAPFDVRASAPDLDWGFATVTILSGSNIHTSASVVDAVTNDPTTITPKM